MAVVWAAAADIAPAALTAAVLLWRLQLLGEIVEAVAALLSAATSTALATAGKAAVTSLAAAAGGVIAAPPDAGAMAAPPDAVLLVG